MEALLYDKLSDLTVRCNVCNFRCVIKNHKRGICGVRENTEGVLHTLNYNKAIAVSIDPIEKKPIYDFLPKTSTYSFATSGCNMHCLWCQNHDISQSPKPNNRVFGYEITPLQHVKTAIQKNCPSISYTYSEPTIFLEYALETMKIAKDNGLKNIWVSNGYMSKETLELILPYLDAANIDYKGADSVYKKYCGGSNLPVLENMKTMIESGIHLEVTTLLVPGINTELKDIGDIASDLVKFLGTDFVWHITRFFPNYKMLDKNPTEKSILMDAREIGKNLGIKKIYLGNI